MAFAEDSSDQLIGLVLIGSVVPWRSRGAEPETADQSAKEVRAKDVADTTGVDNDASASEQNRSGRRTSSPLSMLRLPGASLIGRYIDPALLAERAARSAYGNQEMVTEGIVQRYIDLSLRKGSRAALFKRMASRTRQATPPPTFAGPVLIQWGSDDTWTPPNLIQPLVEAFPQASVVVYEETGHLPMEENPAPSVRICCRSSIQSLGSCYLILTIQPLSFRLKTMINSWSIYSHRPSTPTAAGSRHIGNKGRERIES